MKTDSKIIIFMIMVFAMISLQPAKAQQNVNAAEAVDSVIYRPASAVDSTLVGRNVFRVLPSKARGAAAEVVVHQSANVEKSMGAHVEANRKRDMNGYRVRIFFDNKQTARVESENTLKRFNGLYHDVAAYRSYANPYFKVTVGDFRTKSEAMELLERIKGDFPSAFVVKENISFPVVDKKNAFVADTVKVLRQAPAKQ